MMCQPEWRLQCANHKKFDKRPFGFIRTCLTHTAGSGGTFNLLATREKQNHVEKMNTSLKQKVHAESERQQVFHIIWGTNLSCVQQLRAAASRPCGQRQLPKSYADETKQDCHWDCHDGWMKGR